MTSPPPGYTASRSTVTERLRRSTAAASAARAAWSSSGRNRSGGNSLHPRVHLEPGRERLVAGRDACACRDHALDESLLERGPALRPFVGDRDEDVAEDLLDAHPIPLDQPSNRRRREAVAVGEAEQVVLRQPLARDGGEWAAQQRTERGVARAVGDA